MIERARAYQPWLLLVAGVAWLWAAADASLLGTLIALPPGILMIATGGAELLWSGDRRIVQFGALGGAVGVVLAIPALLAIGLAHALLLALLSAAAFVASGQLSLRSVESHPDVPPILGGISTAAKVALDEALLSTMSIGPSSVPRGDAAARIRTEVQDATALFRDRGWLEKPESYHAVPLPLEAPRIETARHRGRPYEHLSFDSEYEPHAEEPGRDRWLGYAPNRTAHAWVLRHAAAERPWLVCIHGYQMGTPMVDLGAFDPRYYHQKLGLNMLLPVLPLHGKRKVGRRSGDGFLAGHSLDTVHAEAQAMWDIRRLLSWVRAQGASQIGVLGLSLGGYNTALLASVEEDLACAIPGIPATDFARLLWEHSHDVEIRGMEEVGLTRDAVSEVFSVISPLVLEPKVAAKNRSIFAGVVDRLVPPEHVCALHEHWDRPRITWYQGGHVTFSRDSGVREGIETTLRGADLIS